MTQTQRQQVFQKTGGHCAYCGCELPSKGWHLDHVKPVYRGHDGVSPSHRGTDTVDNALPACARCNRIPPVTGGSLPSGFRDDVARCGLRRQ